MNRIRFAYRITHINNIPNIMQVGIVSDTSSNANPNYISIGDPTAIETRRKKLLSDGSRIGDYIPFYFGPRTPMLYVIQKGYNGVKKQRPEDIVYCVIELSDIIRDNIDCVFTDGHALEKFSITYPKECLKQIDQLLSWDILYTKNWKDEWDVRRRKQAELLLREDLPAKYIKYYLVFNEAARQKIVMMGADEDMVIIPNPLDLYYYDTIHHR